MYAIPGGATCELGGSPGAKPTGLLESPVESLGGFGGLGASPSVDEPLASPILPGRILEIPPEGLFSREELEEELSGGIDACPPPGF